MPQTTPTVRRRRPTTARYAAEKMGVSVRTIHRWVSEPREVYESRADYRRRIAFKMRNEGATWAEIAKAVGGTEWAARALVRRAALLNATPASGDSKSGKSGRG